MDYLYESACAKGNLNTAKWIQSLNNPPPVTSGISSACLEGQVEVVQWILSHKPPVKDVERGFYDCHHNVEIIKLLLEYCRDEMSDYCKSYSFSSICYDSEFARWFYENVPNIDLSLSGYKSLCYAADKETFEWILSLIPSDVELYKQLNHSVFYCASREGDDLEYFKWLYEKSVIDDVDNLNVDKQCELFRYTIFDIFIEACHNNNVNIAKWLISKHPNIDVNRCFNECFEYKTKETSIWLYETYKDVIQFDFQERLRYAFYTRNLNLMKLIHRLKPDIDFSSLSISCGCWHECKCYDSFDDDDE